MSEICGLISTRIAISITLYSGCIFESLGMEFSKLWDILNSPQCSNLECECVHAYSSTGSGGVTLQFIASYYGLTTGQFAALSIACGISLAALTVIAVTRMIAINKSLNCESVHAIASCHKQEESNAAYEVSPFVRHCNAFFNDFLDGNLANKRNVRDSPRVC
eukprot:1079853_1